MDTKKHIAEIDFVAFYAPAFQGDNEAAARFLQEVKDLPKEHARAKIALHQAARMVWLGDQIEEIAAGRPALQILFLLIAAEAVSKIVFKFTEEGRSREFVRRFFEEICNDDHRAVLASAFSMNTGGSCFTVRQAVDLLYSIRCDVVHEGKYYTFHMRETRGGVPLLNHIEDKFSVVTHLTLPELRQIVIEGAVLGSRMCFPPRTQ